MIAKDFQRQIRELSAGRIARGSISTFVIYLFNSGLTFLTAMILAKLLGAEQFGHYSFAIALSGMLAIPAGMGFKNYLVKEIAILNAEKCWNRFKGLCIFSLFAVLLVGVIVSVLIYYGVQYPFSSLPTNTISAVEIGIWIVVPSVLIGTSEGILRGLHRSTLAQFAEFLVRPIVFLLFVLCLWLFFDLAEITAIHAVALNLATAVISAFVALTIVYNTVPKRALNSLASYEYKHWMKEAGPFLSLTVVSVLLAQMDVIMLGFLSTAEQTGQYRISSRVASLTILPLIAISFPLLPRIAHLFTTNNRIEVQTLLSKASRFSVLLGTPIAIVLIFSGEHVLTLFGPDFVTASLSLAILSLGFLSRLVIGPADSVLNMTGYAYASLKIGMIAVMLNFILNLLLIPKYGSVGAAFAFSIGISVSTVIAMKMLRRKTGLASSIFSLSRYGHG
ncbi:flippase [Gammaproteobacteria bacterium]|nr:flippase [Gammaproteobacteria bacterium]